MECTTTNIEEQDIQPNVLSDTYIYSTTTDEYLCFFAAYGNIVAWKDGEEPECTPHLSVYNIIRLTRAQLTDLTLHNFDVDAISSSNDNMTGHIWDKVYVIHPIKG